MVNAQSRNPGVVNKGTGYFSISSPEADWNDATVSLDMTHHVCQAAADSPTVQRLVFATSNHVMGRYKDSGLQPGQLNTDLDAGVGTLWNTGHIDVDSTIYAVAKFAGERLGKTLGKRTNGQTSFACIRIGWCQPGNNRPETLSAAGTPTETSDTNDPELEHTNHWFKTMWLSNRDFLHLYRKMIVVYLPRTWNRSIRGCPYSKS